VTFIGYTSKLGRVDVDNIEKYRSRNAVDEVVVFCQEDPAESVKSLVEEKGYKLRIDENPRKAARALAKELKSRGEKVEVFDLQDFGERAIRDVC